MLRSKETRSKGVTVRSALQLQPPATEKEEGNESAGHVASRTALLPTEVQSPVLHPAVDDTNVFESVASPIAALPSLGSTKEKLEYLLFQSPLGDYAFPPADFWRGDSTASSSTTAVDSHPHHQVRCSHSDMLSGMPLSSPIKSGNTTALEPLLLDTAAAGTRRAITTTSSSSCRDANPVKSRNARDVARGDKQGAICVPMSHKAGPSRSRGCAKSVGVVGSEEEESCSTYCSSSASNSSCTSLGTIPLSSPVASKQPAKWDEGRKYGRLASRSLHHMCQADTMQPNNLCVEGEQAMVLQSLMDGCENLHRHLSGISKTVTSYRRRRWPTQSAPTTTTTFHSAASDLHSFPPAEDFTEEELNAFAALVQQHEVAVQELRNCFHRIATRRFPVDEGDHSSIRTHDAAEEAAGRRRQSHQRQHASSDISSMEARLTFEAERCECLRSFLPLYTQLCAATEHLTQQSSYLVQ